MAEMRNWLVYGIVNRELRRALSVYAKGKLLDIGCGDKPYQGMAAPYVQEHIGLDHPGTLHDASRAELIGGAYDIPLDDDSVDTVLCTAVLEHLEEPEKALREAYRVLKEGGYAIYTVPLFWHLHEEPRDFYRFTKYGLRYLFEKSGFDIVELTPLSGFWVTFGQELVYYMWRFRGGGRYNPLRLLIPALGLLIQALCYLLDKIDSSSSFTWMYLVVAGKAQG